MKALPIWIILILFSNLCFPQYTTTSGKPKYLKEFLNSTTVVPLFGNKEIDAKIKKVMDERWTFTEIRYVNIDEAKDRSAPNTSYIDILSLTVNDYHSSKNLCISLPGILDFTRMKNIIASVPLQCGKTGNNTLGEECDYNSILYKIDILLNQLIEVVEFMQQTRYTPTLAHVSGIYKYAKKYNQYVLDETSLPGLKKLIINQDFFHKKFKKEDFGEVYPFSYEIVSDQEYKSIIKSGKEDYFILLLSQYPSAGISVYDPGIKRTLFIDVNDSAGNTSKGKMYFRKRQISNLAEQLPQLIK